MPRKYAPLFITLLSVFMGIWVASQWVASMLDYHRLLGEPAFTILGRPVYGPHFLEWWHVYGDQAPNEFGKAFNVIMVFAVVGFCFSLYVKATQPKKATSYGTARWAEKADMKEAGLLDNKGVVMGLSHEGEYLRHDGPEHIVAMAPTRSGKGVGIIIPTLLAWPHSVLVTDIKGENWGITAAYRKEKLHNRVLKFDPTDASGNSVRYNPLAEIRIRTQNEVRDVQNIADMLVDPQGTGQLDHWGKTAHALLVGIALHLKYTQENATLTSMAAFLSNPDKSFEETLADMLTAEHDTSGVFKHIYGADTALHPVVAQAARELLNKEGPELSGVLSTAISFLSLYRDPVIAYNTSASEFSITDLMNHDKPVSLYLVIPPSDISRTKPLVRMILEQVIRRLTEEMKFEDGKAVQHYKHRMLLLLDEFPALGRLDTFETALAYIAGYGLKALIIIQSINQLNKAYTHDNSIIDNCHIRICYTPNDDKTPEFISKLLGTKTEIVENRSYSGATKMLGQTNVSTQEISRPLMTPGEVSMLPKDEELIFVAGFPPIHARKLFYFKDKNFQKRLLGAPPKTDIIRPVAAGEEQGKAELTAAAGEVVQPKVELPQVSELPAAAPAATEFPEEMEVLEIADLEDKPTV